MIDHFPLPTHGRPERRHLYRWIKGELDYVIEKYDNRGQREVQDASLAVGLDEYWYPYVTRYLDAAKHFLAEALIEEDPAHKERLQKLCLQAMAKATMTAKDMVESGIRVFGSLPKPGVTSGEVLPWIDPAFTPVVEIPSEGPGPCEICGAAKIKLQGGYECLSDHK